MRNLGLRNKTKFDTMKNKRLLFILMMSFLCYVNNVAAALLQDCDSVTRSITGFNSVTFDGGFDVVLVPSDKESISIHTDRDKIARVKTVVINGKLRVFTEEALQYYKVKIVVRYKKIDEIKLNGGVYLKNMEMFRGDSLKLKVAGGADIKMFLQLNHLDLDFAGGANAEISGTCESMKISINGAGKLESEKVIAKDVKVEISGAGYANVYADRSIDASISGVGAINYSGKPARVKSQILGIGSIKEK